MTLAAVEAAILANDSAYGAMLADRRAGLITAEEAAIIAADLHAEEAHLHDLRFDATNDATNDAPALTAGSDEEIAAEVLADIRAWSPRVAGVVSRWAKRNGLTLCHVDINRFRYEAQNWHGCEAGERAHIDATDATSEVLVMKVERKQKGREWFRSICDAPGMDRAEVWERPEVARCPELA
jgi:hypothetical protein